jgi:prophage maintenance system killer protein
MNHPFLDSNKRTAHAAMEVFFVHYEVEAIETRKNKP